MGAHSLPDQPTAGAARLAGTGVLAALALASTAGLAGLAGTASAHDTGQDDGDGHRHEASRADDQSVRTVDDPGGICAVLGDIDVPGLDCSSSTGHPSDSSRDAAATSSSRATSAAQAEDPAADDTPPSAAPAPAAGSSATAQQAAEDSSAPKPRTTGNPIDAPGAPGTTRTLPIRG